jgi:hypothetical protein
MIARKKALISQFCSLSLLSLRQMQRQMTEGVRVTATYRQRSGAVRPLFPAVAVGCRGTVGGIVAAVRQAIQQVHQRTLSGPTYPGPFVSLISANGPTQGAFGLGMVHRIGLSCATGPKAGKDNPQFWPNRWLFGICVQITWKSISAPKACTYVFHLIPPLEHVPFL